MTESVYDPVRRRNVPATPEEGVRQAVIRWLIDVLRVPPNLMAVEFSLAALEPGNLRRADVAVWTPGAGQLAPWLLVECKAPTVPIGDATALQAADYLRKIPCAYVMLSNGKDSRYLEKQGGGYRLIASLPFYPGKS